MSRTLTNKFLMVIAFLGVIVTLILTIEHFNPGVAGLCRTGTRGCEGVLKSAYGKVAGVPTAILGLGMYLTFLYLGSQRGKLLAKQARLENERAQAYAEGEAETGDPALRPQIAKLDQLVWMLAASAFAISWWLQYTALYTLMAFCPWCFTSALLVTLLFLLTSYDHHFAGQQSTGEKKMLAGIATFVVALMLFMNMPEIMARYTIIKNGKDASQEIKIKEEMVHADDLVAKTRWWTGNASAKVTMIEFADYMCPTCRVAHDHIKEYLKMRSDAIRVGFLNFPVPIAEHKWSRQAAAAAEAAGKQGKFWEMHDALFAHQEDMKSPEFVPEKFDTYAQELGLNVDKFHKDREDPKTMEIVATDFKLGEQNQVTGTPTAFFIKDKLVVPAVGGEPIKKAMMDRNSPLWKDSQ